MKKGSRENIGLSGNRPRFSGGISKSQNSKKIDFTLEWGKLIPLCKRNIKDKEFLVMGSRDNKTGFIKFEYIHINYLGETDDKLPVLPDDLIDIKKQWELLCRED